MHGVDETGKSASVRQVVKRAALFELIAKLAPCLIGMEACSGAHHCEQRTATPNRIRGLLSELGVVLSLKAAVVRRGALQYHEDLPGWANTVVGDLLGEVRRLEPNSSAK